MNEIADLVEMAGYKDANVALLIEDAYSRGLVEGKNLAKAKAIEAIEQEK